MTGVSRWVSARFGWDCELKKQQVQRQTYRTTPTPLLRRVPLISTSFSLGDATVFTFLQCHAAYLLGFSASFFSNFLCDPAAALAVCYYIGFIFGCARVMEKNLYEVKVSSNVLIESPVRRLIKKIINPSKMLTPCKINVFLRKKCHILHRILYIFGYKDLKNKFFLFRIFTTFWKNQIFDIFFYFFDKNIWKFVNIL